MNFLCSCESVSYDRPLVCKAAAKCKCLEHLHDVISAVSRASFEANLGYVTFCLLKISKYRGKEKIK